MTTLAYLHATICQETNALTDALWHVDQRTDIPPGCPVRIGESGQSLLLTVFAALPGSGLSSVLGQAHAKRSEGLWPFDVIVDSGAYLPTCMDRVLSDGAQYVGAGGPDGYRR